jgi:flagellar protein FlaG
MELDIASIARNAPVQEIAKRQAPPERDAAVEAKQVAQKLADAAAKKPQDRIEVERYLSEIVNYTAVFNKRLRFSINEELNQVVVKVIDSETDKVIKEIPPEVIQRMHVRIREAIGLLIDEII